MFLYCELLSWNYFILMTMRSAESVLRTYSYTKFFARKEIFEKNSLLERNFLFTFKVSFVFEERLHEKLYQGRSLVIYCIYSNVCTILRTELSNKFHENKITSSLLLINNCNRFWSKRFRDQI